MVGELKTTMNRVIQRVQAVGVGAIGGAGLACIAPAVVTVFPFNLPNEVIGVTALSFAGIGGLMNGVFGDVETRK